MSTAMTLRPQVTDVLPTISAEDMERGLACNDLSKMPAELRVRYYAAVCDSVALNPLTRPFILLKNQAGEMVLYATAGCAEQLRKRDRISIKVLSRETDEGLYCVTVQATTPDGRCEESQGIIDVTNLKGNPLAIARMKCETKAKRRVTMSICGMGFSTEDDSAGAQPVGFNPQTGEIPQAEDDPFTDVAHEPSKTVDELVDELFPRTDGAQAPRRTALGQQIDQGLSLLGATATDADAWWDKMSGKYAGLSPATLSLLNDQIQAKVAARQATETTEEADTQEAPSEDDGDVPVVTGDDDQEIPF